MLGRVEGKQNQFQPLTLESSHVRIDYKRRHHWKLSKLYDQRKRDDGKHLCFTFSLSVLILRTCCLRRSEIGYSLKYSGRRSRVMWVVGVLRPYSHPIRFRNYFRSLHEFTIREKAEPRFGWPIFPANNLHQCNDVAYLWKKHHPEGVFSSSSRHPYYAPNSLRMIHRRWCDSDFLGNMALRPE